MSWGGGSVGKVFLLVIVAVSSARDRNWQGRTLQNANKSLTNVRRVQSRQWRVLDACYSVRFLGLMIILFLLYPNVDSRKAGRVEQGFQFSLSR